MFFILLITSFAAGSTGALFPTGDWYAKLQKPRWTPPNWLFPVAWTSLYLLMSFAGARVASIEGAEIALALWALQIVLNTLWTPVFFGLHRMRAGMVVLIALWISVAALCAVMFSFDWIAGLAIVPYVVWVTVAGALNASMIRLNPTP